MKAIWLAAMLAVIAGRDALAWGQEGHSIVDDYFQKVLPTMDRQLGLAGLRLARVLNEAFAPRACPAPLRR